MTNLPYPYADETPEERKYGTGQTIDKSNGYKPNQVTLKELYELEVNDQGILDFGQFALVVTKRADDWHVSLNDGLGSGSGWTCHTQLDYAVGYMVLVHYDRLATGEIRPRER